MDHAVKVVAERLTCAAERQFLPRNFRLTEGSDLKALVVVAQVCGDCCSRVDDDHRGAVRVGIDADEAVEADIDAGFLAGFTDCGGADHFTAVHISPGKDPEPITRLYGAAHHYDSGVGHSDDCADRDLRVEI